MALVQGCAREKIRKKSNDHGFTVLEMLLVLVAIGILSAVGFSAFRPSPFSALVDETEKMAELFRFVSNNAIISGRYYRVGFDFETREVSIEVSERPFQLNRAVDGADVPVGSPDLLSDQESTSEDSIDKLKADSRVSEFLPADHFLLKSFTLSKKVKVTDAWVASRGQIREGRFFLHFAPTGWIEKALIHFADPSETYFYSLETFSVSGKIKLYNEYRELPEPEER